MVINLLLLLVVKFQYFVKFLFRIFFGKKLVFINVKCVVSAKFATFAKKLNDKRKLLLSFGSKRFHHHVWRILRN